MDMHVFKAYVYVHAYMHVHMYYMEINIFSYVCVWMLFSIFLQEHLG